jgi:hypothetical protein
MFDRASSSKRPQTDDEPALLIAALDHSWASHDARLSRGLQVVSYYLVALAILANAYVAAFNAKLYMVAAVIGLSGLALTVVTSMVGFRQRRMARFSELALIELQDRVAGRLEIEAFRIQQEIGKKSRLKATPVAYFAVALAALLSVGAAAYALIH